MKIPACWSYWRYQECGMPAKESCRQQAEPSQERGHGDYRRQGHRGKVAQALDSSIMHPLTQMLDMELHDLLLPCWV
jgi:hypothetical protein